MLMAMSAVPFPVTERQIDDRRRLGIDKRDERWAGEWHLVNPPKRWHDLLGIELALVLAPLAKTLGMEAIGGAHGVFGAADDWRVPDQVYARPEDGIDQGYVSAELVVEIRSPGDDSYRKLGFYAARGVGEVLILHEDRRVELFRLGDDGVLAPVTPADGGAVCCEALGVTFTTVAGPRLRVAWDGGCAEI
jgi:Uma2 family endonuclease